MSRGFFIIVTVAAGLAAAQPPAPTYIPQTKFSRGQDVVPSFDGWIRNPDGTFTLVFGYMNRNYEEELAIPAGADNKIELSPSPARQGGVGPMDQGQPTYFLPRRHAWVFRVIVPADFGNKEVVWIISANGRTEKAYGHLIQDEEILERLIQTRGNLSLGLDDPNQPPSISIARIPEASAGAPVSLTAMVTDDGLPKPRAPKERPAGAPDSSKGKAQSNNSAGRPRAGLTVTWFEYRGPAKVAFDNGGLVPVDNGQAVTRATFPQPGTYVLRATANDGELSTPADVTILVGR